MSPQTRTSFRSPQTWPRPLLRGEQAWPLLTSPPRGAAAAAPLGPHTPVSRVTGALRRGGAPSTASWQDSTGI